jgi:hypothetical protein
MSRCQKCDGCTNMRNMYRPTWCEDENCPEGEKEPEEVTKEREIFNAKLRNGK